MNSADYWKKRSEQNAKRQFDKADTYEQAQRKEYDRASLAIKRDIELFYQRFAVNNEISLAEARKQLTTNELKEFRITLEEFTAKAKGNADGRWTKELNSAYYRTRISRLEALQMQIGQHVEMLAGSRQVGTGTLLGDIYKDTYYRTLFELQKGTGLGVSFAKIDEEGLRTILGTKLDGRNWSQRIWDDRTKLRQELQTKLSQSFIRGDSVDRTVRDLADRMNVSRSNAERLVQTESAFFTGQATMNGYKESGIVQQYEILATLDSRTSSICRGLDGKVFPLSEMEVGVNYPPFHVRCRTTTAAYFDDDINVGERIARYQDGKAYFVPGDMTYEKWEQKDATGEVNEPSRVGFNRKYNPKASYFAELPGASENLLEKLADINRSIARIGYKESKELLIVVDEKGEELGRASGTIDNIKFPQELHDRLINEPKNTLVLTHNHPRGTRINVKDIRNLSLYPSIAHIVAVGHDGGISFVSTNGKNVDLPMFNAALAKTGLSLKHELQRDKKYATMSKKAQEEWFDYLWVNRIINELGWSYGEDFEKAKQDNRFH